MNRLVVWGTKLGLCHRTGSAKQPHVLITVASRGALRGNLRGHPADIDLVPAAGCPKVALSPTAGGTVLTATMSGANEVPADPDGSGTAIFVLARGSALVCYPTTVEEIALPANGRAHPPGCGRFNGPIVVPLKPPERERRRVGLRDEHADAGGRDPRRPVRLPANVHTTDHPVGAIRGQR